MSTEVDCWLTDTIICPYCGHDNGEPEGKPSHREECEECGKKFSCEADYSVTYSTAKVDCWNGAPHEFKASLGFPTEPGGQVPYNCRACGFCEWRTK